MKNNFLLSTFLTIIHNITHESPPTPIEGLSLFTLSELSRRFDSGTLETESPIQNQISENESAFKNRKHLIRLHHLVSTGIIPD